MDKPLKRDTFELRFFPIAAFFGRKSELLDLLYRDPKTRKHNFEHWQFEENRIILFDADKSRVFSFSFQNCQYQCENPATDGFARDQILKYAGTSLEFFGDKIETILRIGYRQTQVFPVDDFDKLSQLLAETFIKTDNILFKSLEAPIVDVQLFPTVFKHGANRFQITLGPVKSEQLKALWGADATFPEQALFLDVDYYAVQPKGATDDLRHYVVEFLGKANEILAKVNGGISDGILKVI